MTHNPSAQETDKLIDSICDRFEAAWKGSPAPQLEDFLTDIAEAQYERLLGELLKVEIQLLVEKGEPPKLQPYYQRFPEQLSLIDQCFQQVMSEKANSLESQNTVVHKEAQTAAGSDTQAPPIDATRLGSDALKSTAISLTGKRFGDYELIEEIARGGMGVVYKAQQRSLNRTVALKMILSGELASKEEVVRFRSEAESAAGLNHPNIVTIHEVGVEAGQHFFSMDYIEGRNLDQLVDGNPIPARQAASYLVDISEAIEYAHQQGTLHRDLKPSNILIDHQGTVQITDFGLAKQIQSDGKLTGTGQLLGTPAYMSPEQAAGDKDQFGPAMDLYSLGAILYELLTGRPPFQAESSLELIIQVLEMDPVSPRLLNPNIPRDLETICLKCLAKEPTRRYATAADLAADLQRWLHDQPIKARPVSLPERSWRWCRRKPAIASLSLAVVIALMGGISVSWYYAIQAQRQADDAQFAARRARNGERDAREAEALERQAREEADKAQTRALAGEQQAKLAQQRAEEARQQSEQNAELAERNLYVSNMLLAHRNWQEGRIRDALNLLEQNIPQKGQPDRRSFEWYYLQRQIRSQFSILEGHTDTIYGVSFSPDGTMLASVGKDLAVKIWDVQERREKLSLSGHQKPVRSVVFSPDNRQLATSSEDGTAMLWDLQSGKKLFAFRGHTGTIRRVRFNPQGSRLVTASFDKTARVWNTETGELLFTLGGHKLETYDASYSPDGKTIATVSLQRAATYLWDAETGKRISTLTQAGIERLDTATFSPDGQYLLIGARDGMVYAWDLKSRKLFKSYPGHVSKIPNIQFNSDGSWFVCCGQGIDVTIREFPSGQVLNDLKVKGVEAMSLHPSGRMMATGGTDQTVKIWPVGETVLREAETILDSHTEPVNDATIHPDGTTFATASWDDTVRIWDRVSGECLATYGPRPDDDCYSASFSPDGKRLVAGYSSGTFEIWDTQSHQRLITKRINRGDIYHVTFSPDSKYFATTSWDDSIRVWKTADGQLVKKLKHNPTLPAGRRSELRAAAFSPDGNWLVAAGQTGTLRIWSTQLWLPFGQLKQHQGMVHAVTFSPNGRLLASAGSDQTVVIWDFVEQKIKHICRGHVDQVYDLVFSPDGKRVISGSGDKSTKFWDVFSGQEVMTLTGHYNKIRGIAIDPLGQFMVTTSKDKTVRLWNASPWQPAGVQSPD